MEDFERRHLKVYRDEIFDFFPSEFSLKFIVVVKIVNIFAIKSTTLLLFQESWQARFLIFR
jgi:hypothetical protein